MQWDLDLNTNPSSVTRYGYNLDGQLVQAQYPRANTASGFDTLSYTYTPGGQTQTVKDGRGTTATYSYADPEGLLTGVSYDNGRSVDSAAYTYDAWGRPQSMQDGQVQESFTYTSADVLQSVSTRFATGAGGLSAPFTLSYSYHADGSRAGMSTPGGSFGYGYDDAGRLTNLSNPQQVASTWAYDAAGRLQSHSSGNRIATRYAYSALGQLLGLKNVDLQGNGGAGSVLSQFGHMPNAGEAFNPQQVLAYDGAMNLVRRVVDVPGQASLSSVSTYGYDEGDQITSESSTRGDGNTYSRTWNYDHAGNPTGGSNTSSNGGGTPATSTWARTFNESNQETTLGIDPDTGQQNKLLYQYDGNGNPTLYKGVAAAYDARDRMIAWGRMRAGYRSDGKRAWKVALDQEGQEVARKYFLYDGGLLLCEIDGQGRVTSTRTWGANGLVSKASTAYDAQGDASTSTTFYAFDERGSVAQRMVVAGAGVGASTSIAHASFDSWGNGSAGGDSVGFGGQWGYYTDSETGLILCTHRYYDPGNQRWVTRDPIDYAGGINLYGYVTNNPVNAVDPDGLKERLFGDAGHIKNYSSFHVPVIFDTEGEPAYLKPKGETKRVEWILFIPPGYQSNTARIDIRQSFNSLMAARRYQSNTARIDIDYLPYSNFGCSWEHIGSNKAGFINRPGLWTFRVYDLSPNSYIIKGLGPGKPDRANPKANGFPEGYGPGPRYRMSLKTALRRGLLIPNSVPLKDHK